MSTGRAAGNSGDRPVSFRLRDAERIGRAVAEIENARRGKSPSSLPRAAGGGGGVVFAKFTGAWAKGQQKEVQFTQDTTATAVATNVMFTISPHTAGLSRICALSADLTLISVECSR